MPFYRLDRLGQNLLPRSRLSNDVIHMEQGFESVFAMNERGDLREMLQGYEEVSASGLPWLVDLQTQKSRTEQPADPLRLCVSSFFLFLSFSLLPPSGQSSAGLSHLWRFWICQLLVVPG